MAQNINVTKTFLPPFEAYEKRLKEIWESGWITNNGVACRELEDKLAERFKVPHVILVNNGTIAIQIALKALELKGDIITTPFSYVATTSSISWEGCSPVFADIDPHTWNISPEAVGAQVTKATSAILATHVFGNPCDVAALDKIKREHGLSLIYDGAHAFDVEVNGESVLQHGECTTLSFHATKLFHTVEGGAIVCTDDEVAHRCRYMRNFGHNGKEEFWGVGVNGKISEFHAAMGLCVLEHVDEIVDARRQISNTYTEALKGSGVVHQTILPGTTYNYAYYPVVLPSETILQKVVASLAKEQIVPRRYFYPSLNTLPYVTRQACPISEDISNRILCLPLYYGLEESDVLRIADIVANETTGL